MRSLIKAGTASALVLILNAGLPLFAAAADPAAAWRDPKALDAVVGSLPAELLPAVHFQRLYFKLTGPGPIRPEWMTDLRQLSETPGDTPVASATRELAKAWIARVQMQQIDGALRAYYRTNVRFPDSLDVIKKDLQPGMLKDPWGDPWVYKPTAPQGFSRLSGQRYQLGPTRYPQLGSIEDAAKASPTPAWEVAVTQTGSAPALSLRAGSGNAAVIQPGGGFENATLIHLDPHWALFAGNDRLFTLALKSEGAP